MSCADAIRAERARAGWTQAELARRAGLPRSTIAAMERGASVPAVTAALAVAGALGTTAEALFGAGADPARLAWAIDPPRPRWPCWLAEVNGRRWAIPFSHAAEAPPPDGVFDGATLEQRRDAPAASTLVLAGCDPAARLLAEAVNEEADVRVIALSRGSRSALDLLGRGLVHGAGVHLAGLQDHTGNGPAVIDAIGPGYELLRVAEWEAGVATDPGASITSVRAALRPRVRWIGREQGSGARQCLDMLFESRPAPRRAARDHRGVADAIAAGWGQAGVCLRSVAEEAGLDFHSVRREPYDLCIARGTAGDRRVAALIAAVRGRALRRSLADIPGYGVEHTGELANA